MTEASKRMDSNRPPNLLLGHRHRGMEKIVTKTDKYQKIWTKRLTEWIQIINFFFLTAGFHNNVLTLATYKNTKIM